MFCTVTAGLKIKYIHIYQPSDRGGLSLVRHVKCLTFLHRTFDVGENIGRSKWSFSTALSVCVFSAHSFWTSSSLDVPAEVTQEEGHTGFFIHLLSAVRALIFSREGFSHSFPSSTVKLNFVY